MPPMELLGQPARSWCDPSHAGAQTRISNTLDTHGFHAAGDRQSITCITRPAPAYCRECHDLIQDALWGAALGPEPEDATHRSSGEMCGAQSDDSLGHARDGVQGMMRRFISTNYL